MPIPDFQSFMLPVLTLASDGKEHSLQEARDVLAAEFNLSLSVLIAWLAWPIY